MNSDPLALPPEEMRRLGYQAVDALVAATTEWTMPPIRRATRSEIRSLLHHPPPAAGVGGDEALGRLLGDAMPYIARNDHPRFFGFIPCSGTWPGAIGDFVASALSLDAAFWLEAGGPAELELTVLDWFKEWIGYPADAEGQLTSGGSVANLQAIACARELRVGAMRGDLVLYVSDQSHSSVARAARVLGFLPEQVRVLPTDRTFRLRPETLAAAIDADIERSFTPLLACVSAGATNTGAVDPLCDIAALCAERGVWLHADAAYGGFAALTDRGRRALDGLELADSVTLDPHKWLYQSFECGSLLVREPRGLSRAFELTPAYLADASGAEAEVNLSDRGIQLSRTSRALKVWLSVQTFGVDAFQAAIDGSLDAAEHAAARIRESDTLELLAEPTLGIVCFRRRLDGADEPAIAKLNAGLARDAEEAGVAFVSSTTLRGRYALRLCPMNHATTLADVDATLDFFESGTVVQPPVRVERYPDLTRSWLRTMTFTEESQAPVEIIASLDLLADIPPVEHRQVADLASVRTYPVGQTIVRQWDLSREFFVVLDGAATVLRGGESLATHRSGAFFGELAALDWGRGYGYARTATVVAAEQTHLLVFAEGALSALMKLSPRLAAAVESVVAERLPG